MGSKSAASNGSSDDMIVDTAAHVADEFFAAVSRSVANALIRRESDGFLGRSARSLARGARHEFREIPVSELRVVTRKFFPTSVFALSGSVFENFGRETAPVAASADPHLPDFPNFATQKTARDLHFLFRHRRYD